MKIEACARGHVGIAAPGCQAWSSRRPQLSPDGSVQGGADWGGDPRSWEHAGGSTPSQAPGRVSALWEFAL